MKKICNRVSTDVVKAMGPNKTPKAMMRASKAAAGIQQIVKRVNEISDVTRVSQAHSNKCSTEDEMLMLKDLRKIKPFERKPGRKHAHFEKIQVSPTSGIDKKIFLFGLKNTRN